jgi:hypothetical protein
MNFIISVVDGFDNWKLILEKRNFSIILSIYIRSEIMVLRGETFTHYITRVKSGYQKVWDSTGPGSNLDRRIGWGKRAMAGGLKAFDLAVVAFKPEGIFLRGLRVRLLGREMIRNSRGETFDDVWQRVDKTKWRKSIVDPRTWPIDPEENDLAREYSLMSLKELEKVLIALLSAEKPVISSPSLLEFPAPLSIFLDELSTATGSMEHHFLTSIEAIKALKGSVEDLDQIERATYSRLIRNAYKYKAFIRELMKRWG